MRHSHVCLMAAATVAALLSGCVSTVVSEAAPVENLIISRIQSVVNEYCRKPKALRLSYRAVAMEATYPHVVKIDCAVAPVINPTYLAPSPPTRNGRHSAG